MAETADDLSTPLGQKTVRRKRRFRLPFTGTQALAVLLGLFLGGGRAMIRVMRGKPAAVEPEFLSLHLDPENKPVHY